MTEREKIIDILNKNFTQEVECTPVYTTADGKEIELPQELCDIFNDIVTQAVIPYFADALIAAGIGDVKDLQVQVDSLEITNIALQAGYDDAEKDRLYWVDKYKEAEHRAEVAERAGRIIQRDMARVFDISNPRVCELIANIWDLAKKQAEKELAEEGKE